jgi:hypothetical protein
MRWRMILEEVRRLISPFLDPFGASFPSVMLESFNIPFLVRRLAHHHDYSLVGGIYRHGANR